MKLTKKDFDEIIEFVKTAALPVNSLETQCYEDTNREKLEVYGRFNTLAAQAKADLACDNLEWIAEWLKEYLIDVLQYDESEIDVGSYDFRKLCRASLQATVDHFEQEKEKVKQEHPTLDVDRWLGRKDGTQSIASQQGETTPSILLDDLWEEFKGWKVKSQQWRVSSNRNHTPKYASLRQFLGNLPVRQITTEMVREYRKLLECLPPSFAKTQDYKDLSGIKVSSVLGKHAKTLDVATVRDYMILVNAFFSFAVDSRYIERNPLSKTDIPPKKKDPRSQQDAFSKEDLEKLFAPEWYHLNEKAAHKFWLPILGLYTGARLEELGKLKTKDIEKVDDIWVLNVAYDEEREGGGIKTTNAIRPIPLHPTLVELKFPEFAQHMKSEGHDRIFPELKMQHGKYTHHYPREFSTYRDKTGVVAPERKKTFHSFRHTFTDNLYKQGVAETVLEELAGRAGKTESTRRYAKGHLIRTLYEAVKLLDYGLDLSHLKKSKWVIK